MNILILGNGFDLAHGLKTSYRDYLNYVSDFEYFYRQRCVNHNCSLDTSICREKDNIWYYTKLFNGYGTDQPSTALIDEQCELLNENLWIHYFNWVHVNDRWVDFEREISRVIQVIDDARRKVLDESRKLGDRKVKLDKYQYEVIKFFCIDDSERMDINDINHVKHNLLNDLNNLIRSYEIYITTLIEAQEITSYIDFFRELKVDKVISFNYTDTYEKWYGKDYINIEYDYIHGKAGNGKDVASCNLVLGIDEYLGEPERREDNAFIEFKKFYQRIYKKTGCKYKTWLGKLNELIERTRNTYPTQINMYFYGHSLDITDGDIIAELIRQEFATSTIYYHSREALGVQIANLVRILDEEEVIERTGAYKPSIIFRPCGRISG